MTNAILPMPPFEWQQSLWDEYYSRFSENKLPHAYLLAGQDGIGVEELALAMGQFLLCLSPLNQIACGRCRGCQLLHADTHPDLKRVHPEAPGKQIKVDQIREIGHFVDQTAQQGGYKVIILSPAESMNINASNALLKNLEEPAGKTVFILVTHQNNRVLPTIRSRCSLVSLFPPPRGDSLAWLESVGIEDADALLFESGGAPLLAKRWHDEGEFQERLAILKDLVTVADRKLEPMAFAKKWAKQAPMQILEPMLICVETILARRLGQRSLPSHYEVVMKALEHCKSSMMFRLRDRLCERKGQLRASPNLNAPLFIEELVLDWSAIVCAA